MRVWNITSKAAVQILAHTDAPQEISPENINLVQAGVCVGSYVWDVRLAKHTGFMGDLTGDKSKPRGPFISASESDILTLDFGFSWAGPRRVISCFPGHRCWSGDERVVGHGRYRFTSRWRAAPSLCSSCVQQGFYSFSVPLQQRRRHKARGFMNSHKCQRP